MKATLRFSFNIDKELIENDKELKEHLYDYIEKMVDILPGTVLVKAEIEEDKV